MTGFIVIFCKKCRAGFRTDRQLRKHMLRHIDKEGSTLSKAILDALKTGPKSTVEIADFTHSLPNLIGLRIRHELEPYGIVKYDYNSEKWELNV